MQKTGLRSRAPPRRACSHLPASAASPPCGMRAAAPRFRRGCRPATEVDDRDAASRPRSDRGSMPLHPEIPGGESSADARKVKQRTMRVVAEMREKRSTISLMPTTGADERPFRGCQYTVRRSVPIPMDYLALLPHAPPMRLIEHVVELVPGERAHCRRATVEVTFTSTATSRASRSSPQSYSSSSSRRLEGSPREPRPPAERHRSRAFASPHLARSSSPQPRAPVSLSTSSHGLSAGSGACSRLRAK